MTDRRALATNDDLEARLADLASALAFPPTPDLATAVGVALRATKGAAERESLTLRRSLRRSLLLAAVLALLVVGGALAVRFGLDLLSIQFGPVPTIAPTPGSNASDGAGVGIGVGLRLGERRTLDDARAAAAFDVLVPAALGQPDVVYLGDAALRGQVAFLYAPRTDLPASDLLGGAGLLITQNRGEPDDGLAKKLVQTGQATVQPVVVDGAPGLWISGQPHFFWYLASDGTHIEDSRRLVGDTLAWERDGVLYRIEGRITLDGALRIAGSMR